MQDHYKRPFSVIHLSNSLWYLFSPLKLSRCECWYTCEWVPCVWTAGAVPYGGLDRSVTSIYKLLCDGYNPHKKSL